MQSQEGPGLSGSVVGGQRGEGPGTEDPMQQNPEGACSPAEAGSYRKCLGKGRASEIERGWGQFNLENS